MVRLTMLPIPVLALIALAGCTESFPDEEMHLGLEEKLRPYEITLDPPEAAPGETVTATLRYHAPRPAAVDARWRVALDYDAGLYGADETERRFVTVTDVEAPVSDPQGFVTQTARFTVPDSTLAWTSAIPATIDDPFLLAQLAMLPDAPVGDPPRKHELDAWLGGLDADDLAALTPAAAAAIQRLADLFACAVRFRVSLDDGTPVDVTRRLTVRHSRCLASPNVNANPEVVEFLVGEIPRRDFDVGDLDDVLAEVVWHAFDGTTDAGTREAAVPFRSDHTYLLRVGVLPQQYTSPFEPGRLLGEQATYSWYYYRLDAPGSGHQFYTTDEGDEAEMFHLDDDEVRLDPPGVGARYRVLSVVRDERAEWERYHASPGSTTTAGEIVFVDAN